MAIITGTAGDDLLDGTPDSDEIDGLGGRDIITGGEGDDVIDGGEGDDDIDGGEGDDVLRGGAGHDSIADFHGAGEMYGGDGGDYLDVTAFDETGIGKFADGGAGDDFIGLTLGDGAAVTVRGGTGADEIYLNLMLGTAEISLGAGDDLITLFHGLFAVEDGFQLFRYGVTTVTDFTEGASGDVINWDNMLGKTLTNWDQSANPFSTGHLRLRQSGSSTLVEIDPDGGGDDYHTLLILERVGKTTLTAENFDGYDPTGAAAVGTTQDGTDAGEILWGTIGDDVAHGFGGSDQFIGNGGADSFYGGDGHDSMFGEVGHDYFDGGAGDDFASAGTGNDHLVGGAGEDRLYGAEGDDLIEGGDGDDLLSAGYGTDTLIGGAGEDRLEKHEGGSGTLDGGEGNDELVAYAGDGDIDLSLLGGDGDDLITVTVAISDPFHDGLLVDGGAGTDRIEIAMNNGPVQVYTGPGQDIVAFTGLNYFYEALFLKDFEAGPWGDRFDWSVLYDRLVGWDGTSNPFALGYVELVQSGNTTLLRLDADGDDFNHFAVTVARFENIAPGDLTTENLGFSPIPVITGTAKDDHLIGTGAAERIDGLASGDTLRGGGGEDFLVGGGGDDLLDGGSGIDRHYGGTGNDIFEVDQSADRVFEREQEGLDLVRSLASFTLPDHVENLTLLGSAANGTGNALANSITGNGAANLLIGGDGGDTLNGAGGIDEMRGGEDDDLYVVDHFSDRIVELGGQGTDTVRSSASYILADHVEHLTLTGGGNVNATGNALANTITGNNGNNRLDGRGGADTMAGGGGHDTYVVNYAADQVIEAGSSGNDTVESAVSYTLPIHVEKLILTGSFGYDGRGNAGANTITGNSGGNFLNGGSGNDVIDAGAGDDQLMGHLGIDQLTGGSGDDRFYFNMGPGAANADDIVDFSAADDALYLLRSAFAAAGPNGTLAASAFHNGAAAADANDRILYDAATGNIFYDADGTGAAAALLFASVAAGTPLTHADFVIYG